MGSFIAKQPNGLYCRFSTIVDCPTHWNMTREEYLNNVTGTVANREEGESILKHYIKPFDNVINYFVPNNMSQEEFDVLVKEMSS
ncbi:hypothetical protein [Bacillus sp. FJAT-22090]|uniref:hypothetical protein n=1 Tax=Bacillus sp. FJAT-22090 TaxID=1581038 RepID=UPI00119F75D5|nr:hypothetical protein [Bacillus sp. FJAT-22090]